MSLNTLLERLNHKRNGEGKYIAVCPAHQDKSPSLSITEKGDGRVLIHCFAGCGALDVLSAVGLEWSELFPEDDDFRNNSYRVRPSRRPQPSEDDFLIELMRSYRARGEAVTDADKALYKEALLRKKKTPGF